MKIDQIDIRFFSSGDIPQLLTLMHELALFEGYLDEFAITGDYLLEHGLGNQPQFKILVAQKGTEIVGYGAFYTVAFTFKARPKIVLKELYFSASARGLGLGKQLFKRLKTYAIDQDMCAIEWLVLENNFPAQAFYSTQNAIQDETWQNWSLQLP